MRTEDADESRARSAVRRLRLGGFDSTGADDRQPCGGMGEVTELLPYHPDQQPLHEETSLWRYVPLKTLFFHLAGFVFLPSVGTLKRNEPFEGFFSEEIKWYNEAFSKAFGEKKREVADWIDRELCSESERKQIASSRWGDEVSRLRQRRLIEFIRNTRYAWCWFESPRESAAMWSVYANQGVAIRTTTRRLRALLEAQGPDFMYRRMRYVDVPDGVGRDFSPEDPVDFALLLRPYFIKRSEYESEREVRFVMTGRQLEHLGGRILQGCDPRTWMSEVRLWPGLGRAEAEVLKDLVKQKAPDLPCDRSELLQAETDRFAEWNEEVSPSAIKSWLSEADDVPAALKRL